MTITPTDETVTALTDMVRGAIAKSHLTLTPEQEAAAVFRGVSKMVEAGAHLRDGQMFISEADLVRLPAVG